MLVTGGGAIEYHDSAATCCHSPVFFPALHGLRFLPMAPTVSGIAAGRERALSGWPGRPRRGGGGGVLMLAAARDFPLAVGCAVGLMPLHPPHGGVTERRCAESLAGGEEAKQRVYCWSWRQLLAPDQQLINI